MNEENNSKTINEPYVAPKTADKKYWFVALLLLFLFLPIAGASFVWTKGFLFIITGILYLFRPTQYLPHPYVIWGFIGFVSWQIFSLIPLGLNSHDWLNGYKELGIILPNSLAVYPRHAVDGIIYFIAMSAWLLWIIDLELDSKIRQQLYSFLALGLAIFGIIGILLGFAGFLHPLATRAHIFTYFPNRNDYGILLGVAGIISLALFLLHLRKGKDRSVALFWLAVNSILIIALFKCLSKSAFIGFTAGCMCWLHLLRKKQHLIYHFKLMLPAFLLLGTALLTLGDRFLGRVYDSVKQVDVLDSRLYIFKDSLACWWENPLAGYGLHSFKAVFRFFQDSSITSSLITHPENDWLWCLVESGAIGFICIILICYGLFRSIGKFHPDENTYSYRLLGVSCLLAILLQSFVNIPLHQPLVFMTSALLFALSRSQSAWQSMPKMPLCLNRIIALFLIISGSTWVYSDLIDANLNTRNSFRHFESKALEAEKQKQFDESFNYAQKAIDAEPLNWQAYFLRASLHLRVSKDFRAAMDDFRRARRLSTSSPIAAYEEGKLWMRYNIKYTELAWAEALRRESLNKDELFKQMLSDAKPYPLMYPRIERISKQAPEWYIQYINILPSEKFNEYALKELEDFDLFNNLANKERELIFKRIITSSIFTTYSEQLTQNLDKLEALNIPQFFKAHLYASIKKYTLANKLLEQSLEQEALAEIQNNSSLQSLERQHKKNPKDIYTAVCLLNAYRENKMWNRAIRVLEILERIDDRPDFVYYWKAVFLSKGGKSEEAWESWLKYLSTKQIL